MGVEGGSASGSVWRVPGMPWLLGSAMLWFAGFALLVPVALLAFTGAAAVSRWGAGGVADHFGATTAIAPLLFTGALGLAGIALRADSVHDTAGRVLVISGLLLVGFAYGGLQNLTLTQAFAAAGEPARNSVSIAWNLSFDAGTGSAHSWWAPSRPRPRIRSRSPCWHWPSPSPAAAGDGRGWPDAGYRGQGPPCLPPW